MPRSKSNKTIEKMVQIPPQQLGGQELPEQSGGVLGLLDNNINWLQSSKYFAGLMMLLLNLGSKYISIDITPFQESVLGSKIFRRFMVFVVFFVATRDIKVSLISTCVFIIIFMGIFNEESSYCLIPNAKNKKPITKDEYQLAQSVVERYNRENR